MKIHVLPENVVDQIAAGEVLERPAHLVKELIENSLDAGATEIDVEWDHGGRHVRIQDNGSGMSREELPLAILRHATSKIATSEDLFALNSFGFRGEALASVAAVSRLTITTRTPADAEAAVLISELGAAGEVGSRPAPVGTTVQVEELFENVPARLKFLKSEAAETSQIKQILKSIALVHPQVQFRIRSRGELLHFWPARADWRERTSDVLEFKSFFEAQGDEYEIQVRALWAAPDQTLRQNRGIWIFVQDRPIQDRALTAAIMESYRNLLMHGEYPQVVLSLHVPKDFVDVNVHPAKSQVKFVDSQKVFLAVVHTLRGALEKAPWLGGSAFRPMSTRSPGELPTSGTFTDAAFSSVHYQRKVFPVAEVHEVMTSYRSDSSLPQPSADRQTFWSQMEVLGQAHQTYILAQSQEQFYFVDQHAAHERIVFERLMEQWKAGKFDSQSLLLPLVVDLSTAEMQLLEEYLEQLQTLGLAVEKMGPEALAVTAIPSFVNESAVVHSIKSFVHELTQNGGSFAWERKVGDIFASMACHSVVRAGQTMSVEEMRSLLGQMDEFPLSTFCPHGRPVSVSWTFHELERKFGRLV